MQTARLSRIETKICIVCHSLFERGPGEWQNRWDRRRFCSRACWQKSRIGSERLDLRRRYRITCQACGREVEAGGRTGRDRQTKFCSRKCAFAARWRTGSKSKQLTIPQAAYLAGVIDGEGSIMLYGRRDSVAMRVAIANTNQ